ncbi:MAG: hypothetical protein WC744_03790 [Patescibacteria group bacterium]|jgi:hypothetical protein
MKTNFTDNESLHGFFFFVSKAVIIIPIFIFIFSLFLKLNVPKTDSENKKLGLINKAPTAIPIVQKNEFKFDLKGPIVCDDLFIHDKKVLFKNKSSNYLLNGDCVYIWEVGKLNGEKKCGLSNYVSMAENYMGLLNINDLVDNNLVKDFIKDKNIDLTNVAKSCKREEIKDNLTFEVPKKIIFKS